MKRKYLPLLLVTLALALPGCQGCPIAAPPAPYPPSDLAGVAVSSSEVNLTWKDSSPDETGFYIYRKTTDNYSRVGVVLANANCYNDKGLDPETDYTYKVTAYNDGGESESSNEITITTPGEEVSPSAPSDLAGIAVAYDQIDLNWQDNSDNEDGFRIECKIYGESDYYEVADLPANTTYFAHSGLEPLRKYTYYVQVYNEIGAADSNIAEATTLSGVEILDYELEKRSDSVRVNGHARNTTNEILAKVRFIYWFYDVNDILIDSTEDSEGSIPPLTTFEFGPYGWGCSGWDRIEYVIVAVTEVEIEY